MLHDVKLHYHDPPIKTTRVLLKMSAPNTQEVGLEMSLMVRKWDWSIS